jgi:hypothetical protein
MSEAWKQWSVAGLLVGGLLAGGCTRDEREGTGAFRTPIQDKYQPPEAGAANTRGPAWSEHPSVDEEQQASEARPGTTDTQELTTTPTIPPPTEPYAGSGEVIAPRASGDTPAVGSDLAETYDVAPEGQEATGGAGRQQQDDGEGAR